jgi:hypothetical protein
MSTPEQPTREQGFTPEKKREEGASIVYIDQQIPGLDLVFSLYFKKISGEIAPEFKIIPRDAPAGAVGGSNPEFLSVFSTSPNFQNELPGCFPHPDFLLTEEEYRGATKWVKKRLTVWERLRNYIVQSRSKEGKLSREHVVENGFSPVLYDTFCGIQLRHFGDPQAICQKGFELLSFVLRQSLDPMKIESVGEFGIYRNPRNIRSWLEKAEKQIDVQEARDEEAKNKGQEVVVTFPKLVRNKESGELKPGETEIEKDAEGNKIWVEVKCPLGALRILERETFGVVILGPPHSGKTSLVLSLIHHTRKFIAWAKEQEGMSDLQLDCNCVDLDIYTPDALRALEPGLNLGRKQIPWSQEVANQVYRDFSSAKEGEHQIIFCDSPGGEFDPETESHKPNDILKTIIAPADAAIVITGNWSHQRAWRLLLRIVGVPSTAYLHSRSKTEINPITDHPIDSAITTFVPGSRYFSGRIAGLKGVKEEDEFIEKAIPLLLLQILPRLAEERRAKMKQQIGVWREEFNKHLEKIEGVKS